MKANELMIGNYVFSDGDDRGVVKILEIKEMSNRKTGNMSVSYLGPRGGYCTTSLEESDTDQDPDDFWIKTIPLTEEWLLKFGFDEKRCIPIQVTCDADLLQVTFNGDVLLYDANYDFVFIRVVKYVHQLQNLYFALTGEELELKQQ